jgi:hypothetical protein
MKDEQGTQYTKTSELKGKGGRDGKAYSSDMGGGQTGARKGAKLDKTGETSKKDASCYSGCEDMGKSKGAY